MRMFHITLLAALGVFGHWHATAAVVPPATNRVALTWSSLGPGTRYYVQTSTNLLTWTVVTNTAATNLSQAFSGDKARMFRLSASNAPPQSVTLAWDPSPATEAVNYNVYYGTASRAYTHVVAAGTNTTVTISNLLASITYYFAVTAVSNSGLESDYSMEVSTLIQARLRIQRLP